MTRGPVDAYLDRLEHELRQRGVQDTRIVEEAREHLLDAVENGRPRGLSIEDAEHEALERFLEGLRAQYGPRPPSQADLLPYEVLKDRYKALLNKGEEARVAATLERRVMGEQFKVVDPPRLPERPLGPSRLAVNIAGAFAGLGLGLVVVRVRGRSTKTAD